MTEAIPELSAVQPLTGQPAMFPLRAVASSCQAGNCPTVYVSDTGSSSSTVVIQGYTVSNEHAGIDVPHGETLVEIPLDLLTEAVRRLSRTH